MRDYVISLPRIQTLHPKIMQQTTDTIEKIEAANKFAIRIVQAGRTIQYQNELYAIGRTVKGANPSKKHPMGSTVTNAKGGRSYHNYMLAIDFAILYDLDGNGTWESLSWDTLADRDMDGQKDWMEVVQPFKDLNWRWGGDWNTIKDNPHLEKTFNYTVETLYNMWTKEKFIPGTKFLNI